MTQHNTIKLFEAKKVRTIWDDKEEKWYFSIVDVVAVLTDSPNPRKYWSVLKTRLKKEGSELTTNCSQLKMKSADGKMYLTDVADTQQLLRLIQSIPSPKAEPFKQWMAQVATERLNQMQDPELSINQALVDYKRLGYSDNWINQRLKSIEIRKDLTDEWKRHGLQEGVQFATLTDIIYQTWSDMTAKEYKQFKGLKKENLRDNMTNKELVLNMLAELSTKEINKIKKMDLARAEIVSTLYAVWNNRIIKGEPISDDLLLEDFYAWSKHKLDFSPDQVLCELNYMRKEEIIPIGWGKYIDKK